MKIIKYICDCCKREISTSFHLVPYYTDGEELKAADKLFHDQEKNDYCASCIGAALQFLNRDDDEADPELDKPEETQESTENCSNTTENVRIEQDSDQNGAENARNDHENAQNKQESGQIDQESDQDEEPSEDITVNPPAPAAESPKKKKRYDPNNPRKKWFLTKEMKEEITRRYRAGEEMEDIAVDMNACLPSV